MSTTRLSGVFTRRGVLPVLFFLLLILLLRRIEELDIWYHLVIGEQVVRTLSIPAREFFVYPHLGDPVAFHEWGFGALFYLAYCIGGYWGMSVLNGAVAAATLVCLYAASPRRSPLQPLPLSLLFALLWFVSHRLVYRPEMMLFLCLAAEMYLLERSLRNGRLSWLLPIPLLTMVLSNFHPSALFLIGIVGFYGVQAVLDARSEARWRTAGAFAGVAAVSLLTAAANPYGFEQVFLPVHFAASKQLLDSIVEFLPTFSTGYWLHFTILAAGSLLLLLVQPKRRVVDWLLFLAFGWLGYRYARNVALFAIVMYLPVVRTCDDLWERFRLQRSRWMERTVWAAAAGAFVLLVLPQTFGGGWGAGAVEAALPVRSAEMIRRLQPAGQLFNFYDYGGFLAWELRGKYKVSIDGRHYGTDKSLILHDEVFQAAPGWQQRLAEHRVNVIVVPALLPYSGKLIPLVTRLALDPEWLLLAREPAGLLFVRGDAIAAGNVRALDKAEVWHQAIAESEAVLKSYPERADAFLSQGKAALVLRDIPLATKAYRSYVRLNPADREAGVVLALLESGRMGP